MQILVQFSLKVPRIQKRRRRYRRRGMLPPEIIKISVKNLKPRIILTTLI